MAESTRHEVEDSEIEMLDEPPKKKCKVYRQKYNSLWEKDPNLNGWLAPVRKDPYKACCKICSKELVAGLSELKKTSKFKETLRKGKSCEPHSTYN